MTWRALAAAAVDGARTVVPVECPGCGAPDQRWCQECEAPWWDDPVRCETSAPRLGRLEPVLPVWSVAMLDGPAHATLAAWKDGGRRDLDRDMSGALRRAARTVAPAFRSLAAPIVVAPCPARAAHTRRRGADLPGMLATAVAAGLRDGGGQARVARLLRPAHGRSRGAGDRGRWHAAAAPLSRSGSLATGAPVLLVDDVLTTGATLVRAAEALAAAGSVAVGALVLAVAPGVHDRAVGALR